MMFSRLLTKIKFTNPEPSPIVILYDYDYWIKELILKELKSTTLDIYPTKLYITPKLIIRTFLRMRFINWCEINKKTILKNLFRQIYDQYLLACIDQTKARVVITAIDNSNFFHKLSRLDAKRSYFAIQNGTRTLSCVRDSLQSSTNNRLTISMTNFFCFGQRDVDLFVKNGHDIDNYFPVGALISGYYKSVISTPLAKPLFDLCLISQWHASLFGNISGDDFTARSSRRIGASIAAMNLFLIRLIAETGLNLVICTRKNDAAERDYYCSSFGSKVKFIESDRKNFSTYRAAEQSRLVVGMNSTTLAEIFSWGHKVLWCNLPNDDHYEMPEAGISYFCGDDYSEFKERVLTLLSMPLAEYKIHTCEGARYINNYNPANPPHQIIRSVILEALS